MLFVKLPCRFKAGLVLAAKRRKRRKDLPSGICVSYAFSRTSSVASAEEGLSLFISPRSLRQRRANRQVTNAGGAIAKPEFVALLGYAMFVASYAHRLSVLSFRNNCGFVMADQLQHISLGVVEKQSLGGHVGKFRGTWR